MSEMVLGFAFSDAEKKIDNCECIAVIEEIIGQAIAQAEKK